LRALTRLYMVTPCTIIPPVIMSFFFPLQFHGSLAIEVLDDIKMYIIQTYDIRS